MSTGEDFGPEGGAYDVGCDEAASATWAQRTSKHRCVFIGMEELFAMKAPTWLVKRLLRVSELAVVYGPPGCGKTFFVIDLLLWIASGFAWVGRKVVAGPVIYLAGEGSIGLAARCQAWALEHPVEFEAAKMNVRILPHAVEFMEEAEFTSLIEALKLEEPKPIAVAIDTLARHLIGGDENDAGDMGIFVERCDRIRQVTGAAVIVVHHTGKDNKNERGSSALRGAADVMLVVTKEALDVTVEGSKCKDGELLPATHFTMFVRHLGVDEDGDAITSLVLIPIDAEDSSTVKAAGDAAKQIRETLAKLHGGEASGNQLLDSSGVARSRFYEVLKEEVEAGRIERVDARRYSRYRLTPKASEYVDPPPSSPSPSPAESANSQSGLAGENQNECESVRSAPLKGAGSDSNSDSRNSSDTSRPRKKGKNPRQSVRKRGGGKEPASKTGAKSSPEGSDSKGDPDSRPDSREVSDA